MSDIPRNTEELARYISRFLAAFNDAGKDLGLPETTAVVYTLPDAGAWYALLLDAESAALRSKPFELKVMESVDLIGMNFPDRVNDARARGDYIHDFQANAKKLAKVNDAVGLASAVLSHLKGPANASRPQLEPSRTDSVLKAGNTYDVVLLSVDLVGSTALKAEIGEDAALPLIKDWQQHLKGIMEIYGAHRISLAGDGAEMAFEGEFSSPRALLACLHILFYPLARAVRPAPDRQPVRIRVALHRAPLRWETDPGTIVSHELDLVCKIQKGADKINQLVVTDTYLRSCPAATRGLFIAEAELLGVGIHVSSLARFSASTLPEGSPSSFPASGIRPTKTHALDVRVQVMAADVWEIGSRAANRDIKSILVVTAANHDTVPVFLKAGVSFEKSGSQEAILFSRDPIDSSWYEDKKLDPGDSVKILVDTKQFASEDDRSLGRAFFLDKLGRAYYSSVEDVKKALEDLNG